MSDISGGLPRPADGCEHKKVTKTLPPYRPAPHGRGRLWVGGGGGRSGGGGGGELLHQLLAPQGPAVSCSEGLLPLSGGRLGPTGELTHLCPGPLPFHYLPVPLTFFESTLSRQAFIFPFIEHNHPRVAPHLSLSVTEVCYHFNPRPL